MVLSMEEIEAKYRLRDHRRLRAALIRNGAALQGEVLQRDTYFDAPGGRLREAGCGLRLRISASPSPDEEEQGGGGDESGIITWKGPTEEDRHFKVRPEVEVNVDSAAAAARLLEGLGFEKVFVLEKRRATYRFGECLVELDILPLIGDFVEIEGPDRRSIEQVADALGIAGAHIPESYLHLLLDHCRKTGVPFESATFSAAP